MLLLCEVGDVNYESWHGGAWEHEVRDSMRAKSLLACVGVILGEPRDVRAFADDLTGVNVIWVRVFPVVSEDDSRTVKPDLAHHLHARLFVQPYVPVGKFEVVTNRELQLASAGLGFAAANFSRATSANLPTGHIQHTHSVPQRNQLQQCSPASKLDIIRVRTYRQRIKPHFIAHTRAPLRSG
jgi:hypothetical protein